MDTENWQSHFTKEQLEEIEHCIKHISHFAQYGNAQNHPVIISKLVNILEEGVVPDALPDSEKVGALST